jgi:hypothetical protein
MGLTRTVHRTLGMGPTAPHIPLSMLSSLPHGPTAQPPACAAGPASGLVDPAARRYDRCPRPRRHPGVYKALAPARPLCSNSNLPSCGQPPPRRSHALRARRLPSSRACLTNMASIAGSSALSFARPVKVILLRSKVASATCCSLVSPDPSLSRPAFCVAHGRGLGGLIRFPACDACA